MEVTIAPDLARFGPSLFTGRRDPAGTQDFNQCSSPETQMTQMGLDDADWVPVRAVGFRWRAATTSFRSSSWRAGPISIRARRLAAADRDLVRVRSSFSSFLPQSGPELIAVSIAGTLSRPGAGVDFVSQFSTVCRV
jgi:hypothetical protein